MFLNVRSLSFNIKVYCLLVIQQIDFMVYTHRLCVNVLALKIHMSGRANDALSAFSEFVTEPRGDISVKVNN